MLAIGLLMERKRSAVWFEYARLTFLAANVGFLFWAAPFGGWIIAAGVVVFATMAVWVSRMRNYFGYLPPEDMVDLTGDRKLAVPAAALPKEKEPAL